MKKKYLSLAVLPLMLLMCNSAPAPAPAPPWSECPIGARTGANASFVFTETSGFQKGDQFSIWTPDGLCVGQAVYAGVNGSLTVWGDNSVTSEKDGAVAGDSLHLKVIIERSVPYALEPGTGRNTTGKYQADAIYALGSFSVGVDPQAVAALQSEIDRLRSDSTAQAATIVSQSDEIATLEAQAEADRATINAVSARGDSLQVIVNTQETKITGAVNVLTS